ncbi:exodeoxyribonuclease III [Bermanella sp. WJH001]|uniref:exodeoxyribonuclease III n=1 Tax=Bermanella sp. WJH001 TaxID=3048005 RepID=UPI0024BD9BBD|nr:exodeoxyribonuclease III [Bermanella sp. WJH001]MDJ1537026.1 exodeoxyribonuclease III [Bermanella sp. WJH001]
MKIVSFNVNGIRARMHQLEAIKQNLKADVLGLQEVKAMPDQLPLAEIEALGWHTEVHSQKAHYGVATLSVEKPLTVQKGFPSDDDESQKRFIHTGHQTPNGEILHIINGYFPQGENRSHETKFPAKQKYYADLLMYLDTNFTANDNIIVMGDINVAPIDQDIGIGEANAKRWLKTGKCAFLPEEREWVQTLLDWGLTDSYRLLNPAINDRFSWFDYRSKGFEDTPKRGLRIDLIMISKPLIERLVNAGIDYDTRAMEKPSDHAPIFIELDY